MLLSDPAWWEERKGAVAAGLAGIVLLGAGVFWLRTGNNSEPKIEVLSASSTETDNLRNESAVLAVDVGGAVVRSGVYRLWEGARVEEAIASAGGITTDADTNWIDMNLNRSEKIRDGMKIYIPAKGAKNDQYSISNVQSNSVSSGKVDINKASQARLEELPGVGPVTAGKIVNNRPYTGTEQLLEKKIVGAKVWEQIKDLVVAW